MKTPHLPAVDAGSTTLYCLMLFLLSVSPLLFPSMALGQGAVLSGPSRFEELTAAQDILKILDSFIFVFGARVLAGLCVLAAGWNLKEQRFGVAIVCIFAAVMVATVPMWVKNIFDIGGGSIFSPPGGG